MGCCGQKRAAFKEQQVHHRNGNTQQNVLNTPLNIKKEEVRFRYIGNTSMLVKGAITFKNYLFRFKGEIILVDERDDPSMMAEPLLQDMPATID